MIIKNKNYFVSFMVKMNKNCESTNEILFIFYIKLKIKCLKLKIIFLIKIKILIL